MQLLDKQAALGFVDRHAALLDQAAGANPFASSAWTRLFIEHIAADDWTVVVPGHDGPGTSLMLLYREPGTPHRLASLTNYYASLYTPLLTAAADRRAAMAGVVGDLDQMRPRFAAIDFGPLDEDATDTALLADACAARGWFTRRYFRFGNWYLPCEGLSFADYMAARDSRLRNTWSRKMRRFQRGDDGARLELVTRAADVDAAMDAYERIYRRSWKVAEPYPEFIRGWARACAREGWLRLGVAWLGDEPIAAQFWFTMRRRAFIFKLAYDEAHARLSAGTVLSALLFEHSLEHDRVVEIDYLTGDDAYKRSWMNTRRERIGLLACNRRTARGLALSAIEWAGSLRPRRTAAPAPAAPD